MSEEGGAVKVTGENIPDNVNIKTLLQHDRRDFLNRLEEFSSLHPDFSLMISSHSIKGLKIVLSQASVVMRAIIRGKNKVRVQFPEKVIQIAINWMYGRIPGHIDINLFHTLSQLVSEWELTNLQSFLVSKVKELDIRGLLTLYMNLKVSHNDPILLCCCECLRVEFHSGGSLVKNYEFIKSMSSVKDYTVKIEFIANLGSLEESFSGFDSKWDDPITSLMEHIGVLSYHEAFRKSQPYVLVATKFESEEGYPCFEMVMAMKSEYFLKLFFNDYRKDFLDDGLVVNMETDKLFHVQVIRRYLQCKNVESWVKKATIEQLYDLCNILDVYLLTNLRGVMLLELENKLEEFKKKFSESDQVQRVVLGKDKKKLTKVLVRKKKKMKIDIDLLFGIYKLADDTKRKKMMNITKYLLANHPNNVEFFYRATSKLKKLEKENEKLREENEEYKNQSTELKKENEALVEQVSLLNKKSQLFEDLTSRLTKEKHYLEKEVLKDMKVSVYEM